MPDKNGKKWLILFPVLSLLLGVTAALQACLYPRLGAPAGTCILLVIMTAATLGLALHFFGKARKEEADTRISGLDRQQLTQQMLQTQAQLASLQSQINPHFLYNTLESIRSKALIHDENEIADMVEALAHLFRYNIGKGDISATLTQELNNIQNYLTIQNYRFRNKFRLEIDLGEIDALADQYRIPVLTLQPIVENAIHYGLEKRIGEGHIFLRAYQTQRNLIIEIRDDGVGMSERELEAIRNKINDPSALVRADGKNQASHGSGIALPNVNRRLKLFFGDDAGLEILSAEGVGTQVSIVMPGDPVKTAEQTDEV